jgi:hypothetical protein
MNDKPRPITVEQFTKFIQDQQSKEFFYGELRDFSLAFVENLNRLILDNVGTPEDYQDDTFDAVDDLRDY